MKRTISERVYRLLLHAYPAEYRTAYGERMAQAFRDQLRDAGTGMQLIRLWLRTVPDWARTVCARHGERLRAGDTAGTAVLFARYEAEAFGHAEITLEDLMLGALRGAQAVAHYPALSDIREALGEVPVRRRNLRLKVPYSEASKRALERAVEEARKCGARHAAARHVMGGILLEEDSLAARLLRERGVDLAGVRASY